LEEYNIENMYKRQGYKMDAVTPAPATAAVDPTAIISTVKELMKTPEMNSIIQDAVAATANTTSAGLNSSSENSADVSIAAPDAAPAAAPAADLAAAAAAPDAALTAPAPEAALTAPAPEATSLDAGSATDNNTNTSVEAKMYDIEGVPGTDTEKHIYKDLEAVNAARLTDNMESLTELKTGGRRRTKHKKHHKKGGKKSHKTGKSSKKVAKRRKSRKTGSRRSRKQNKH
jgi:hypothetical protein